MENDSLFLNDFLEALNEMDESLAKNDINAALKKIHECIGKIKVIKGESDKNE